MNLVETLLAEDGRALHVKDHLARIAASAAALGFVFARDRFVRAIENAARRAGAGRHRVRVLLARDGTVCTEHLPVEPSAHPTLRFAFWPVPVRSDAPWLFHKTTHRPVYARARAAAAGWGVDEFLFVNERGEVTEGTITNVFVEREGTLYTPPVRCGLLPGTLRARLLADGACAERVLYPDDLRRATRVLAGNAVRGLVALRERPSAGSPGTGAPRGPE